MVGTYQTNDSQELLAAAEGNDTWSPTVGNEVWIEKHGVGTVVTLDDKQAVVDFQTGGKKTFVLSLWTPQSPREHWQSWLESCHKQRKTRYWSLGDCLVFADERRKEYWTRKKDMWLDAQRITGEKPESLRQYYRIAKTYPEDHRGFDVPYGVYVAVAGIPDQAKRLELLQQGENEEWTEQDARLHVQELKKPEDEKTHVIKKVRVGGSIYATIRRFLIKKNKGKSRKERETIRAIVEQLIVDGASELT